MPDLCLVTGAAGFLGRHIARAAAGTGVAVLGLGHNRSGDDLGAWGVSRWVEGDVTLEALRALGTVPDVIYHCAGGASVAFSIDDPAEDFRRTVDTTLAVLEFARTADHPVKVIIPSSAGVYGISERMPLRVDDVLRPISPYGLHKKIAEDLGRSYGQHFLVPVAIVRLFSVYGPDLRKQLLWDACRRLTSEDQPCFGGDGEETRDWLHVEDAAALLLAASTFASTDCPVVNGGSGEAISVRDIVNCLRDGLGETPAASFSGVRRAGDPAHYQADVSQALSWGWKPSRDVFAGVRAYADWFKRGAK